MCKTEDLEEWKVNVELYKWHVQIKHARITQFLTIQAGIFAGLAFFLEKSIQSISSMRLLYVCAMISISALGWAFSKWYARADERAAEYLKVVRIYIRKIEARKSLQSCEIRTFTDQFENLHQGNTRPTATGMEALLFSTSITIWKTIALCTFLGLLFSIITLNQRHGGPQASLNYDARGRLFRVELGLNSYF